MALVVNDRVKKPLPLLVLVRLLLLEQSLGFETFSQQLEILIQLIMQS
jgi:hypothetical protein